ncbi:MAG TPA: hypothetical protein VGL47_45695 [Amycolatopsis sp.]|uniref:hypothetical protein n=1 Tax=Amycolatopsis sp. TaxID=37632 RepID=UPI002F3ECB7C
MYRGELNLEDGEHLLWQCSPRPEPPEARNKAVLGAMTLGWVIAVVLFVLLGQSTLAAVLGVAGIVTGGWSEYSRRRSAELVEYFVTDHRIVVHTDEDDRFREFIYRMSDLPEPTLEEHEDGTGTIRFPDGPTLREIDHPQRVYEHVQRARNSAEGTSAE